MARKNKKRRSVKKSTTLRGRTSRSNLRLHSSLKTAFIKSKKVYRIIKDTPNKMNPHNVLKNRVDEIYTNLTDQITPVREYRKYVCKTRKVKRQVLFAIKKAGTGNSRKPVYTLKSKVRC